MPADPWLAPERAHRLGLLTAATVQRPAARRRSSRLVDPALMDKLGDYDTVTVVLKTASGKQAIINNSDCKILLDQSKYQNKFDQIQELLGLTEKEKALVLSVNKANDPDKKYKEVFHSSQSGIRFGILN